jgi:hypothetical protein
VTLPPYAVTFRGHPACPCQVEWLPAFEHEAQRRGILSGPLPISQIIGGAVQSGGTHATGGADDTYPLDGINVDGYVWLSRQMGADATWHRWFNWDGKNGVEHVHRVLTGCIHNSAARYQIEKVRAGLNGLANDFKDDGPRPLSGRTWKQGLAWAKEQEANDVTPDDIEAIAKRTAELVLASEIGNDGTKFEQVMNKLKTWLARQ